MAQPNPEGDRILEGETLKGVEREYRDLVLSLKALAALLREEPAEDPVLTRILESELNQLSVLVGEMCTALKVEDHGPRLKRLDLTLALRQAQRRAGVRVDVSGDDAVVVEADPEVASQAIQSALALAVRLADGSVTARALPARSGGEVVVEIPVEMRGTRTKHRDARLHMLRRLMMSEGGRLVVRREGAGLRIGLWFPSPNDVQYLNTRRSRHVGT